jgi:hypothetical protein
MLRMMKGMLHSELKSQESKSHYPDHTNNHKSHTNLLVTCPQNDVSVSDTVGERALGVRLAVG